MLSLRSSFMLVALVLLPCTAHAQSPTPTPTDSASQYGWLEGTIITEQGNPVQEAYSNPSCVSISLPSKYKPARSERLLAQSPAA